MVNDLQGLIKQAMKKQKLPTEEKRKEVFDYLNSQLSDKGLEGEVVTILVYDGHGKINMFGQPLQHNVVFRKLNLTTGTHGSRVTGIVAEPGLHRLTSYQTGYLVPVELFERRKQQKKGYIALVNIPIDFESTTSEATRYP